MGKGMSDEVFFRRYGAFENQCVDDFLLRHGSTAKELKETIAFLVRHRELLRDAELERLEFQSRELLDKVMRLEGEKMLVEIRCFKEVLSLQKRLMEDGEQGD